MRRIHILMPMGGLGSRFAKEGWSTPKPMIPVDGVPMFRKALGSFDGLPAPRAVTLVIRRELDDAFGLGGMITATLPQAEVVVIPELTRGSVETCLAAAPLIRPDDGVVVLDCDLWFSSPAYLALIAGALDGSRPVDGGLLTFPATSPRYSFAELDGRRVVRTAEKEAISSNALAGAYFFNTGKLFLDAAHDLVSRPPVNEYYVSHLYNIILQRGGHVEAAPVERYASFGTPEELAAYAAES